ncbi:MAG TPA: N-acetylneuraminate synthase family protein [Phycisphaerae bacterium]|nr:N-acetylneuraminate synthase family protein [Phycisphaerae bacterium]
MPQTVSFAGRLIGNGQPPFFIAEIGANHNGDMDLCRRLIDAAADAGADAVKFQSWTDKSLLALGEYAAQDDFLRQARKHQLSPEQHHMARERCRAKGVMFCSTPFSAGEADMLEGLDVPFFKISSMDVNHHAFLRHVARKKRPIILSTGMATLGEIEQAVMAIRSEGNDDIVLLHCVSLYPPNAETVNLRNIRMLSDVFGLPAGFSDHTIGVGCPLAAVALSACVVEKHFTLDKKMPGWDHAVSADPTEMATIIREGREIWKALGRYERTLTKEEVEKRNVFRRSLVTKRSMKAGEVITREDLDCKRPGWGIPPNELEYVVGRKLSEDVAAEQVLRWSQLK